MSGEKIPQKTVAKVVKIFQYSSDKHAYLRQKIRLRRCAKICNFAQYTLL